MRPKLLLLFLLTCPIAFSQSITELRSKYGKPVSETFLVRPGIGVTATYTESGQLTELVIAPHTADTWKSRNTVMDRKLVDGIIDELVPVSWRGRFIIGTFINVQCLPALDCAGTSESFEKLNIYFNSGENGGLVYAVVKWKK